MTTPFNMQARVDIVAVMERRGQALTTAEIAHLTDMTCSGTRERLYSLKQEGIVTCALAPGEHRRMGKAPWYWSLTGAPLPKQIACAAAAPGRPPEEPRYDHHALAHALGLDVEPPAPPAGKTRRVELGNWGYSK